MKLVIEMDEKLYGRIFHSDAIYDDDKESVVKAITSGTPLPKGHGRLKDIDAFINKVEADRAAYTRSWTADDVLNALDKTYAPTIVEAEFPLIDTELSFLSKVKNDMSRINKLSKSKQKYGKNVGE